MMLYHSLILAILGRASMVSASNDNQVDVAATADVSFLQQSLDVQHQVEGMGQATRYMDPAKSWSGAFKTWAFCHVGKAGGGSVMSRARQLELGLQQVHPSPPRPGALEGYPNIMINIRDPIDRFVSAFKWRLDNCNEGDYHPPRDSLKWIPRASEFPARDYSIQTVCTAEEAGVLFVKYRSNVSILAEALCSESEETRKEAAADVLKIVHAKHSLSDWLAAIQMETKESLLAFILEAGFDFDSQIDAGFSWILGENGAEVSRDEFPLPRDNGESLHTTAGHDSPDLTEVGARCLAQYYTKDYQALDTVMGDVEAWCHGDESHTCAAALQSILDRRANLRRD